MATGLQKCTCPATSTSTMGLGLSMGKLARRFVSASACLRSVMSSIMTRHSCPSCETVAVMCTLSGPLPSFRSATSHTSFAWLANTFSRKALKPARSGSANENPKTPTRQPGALHPQQARPGQIHLADRPVAAKGQVAHRGKIVELGVALQPRLHLRPRLHAVPRFASPARSGGPAVRARAAAYRPLSAPGRLSSQPLAAALPPGGAVRRPPLKCFCLFSWGALFRAFFRLRPGLPQLRLQRLGRGDVRKGDHHTVNPVLQGAVGHDAHQKPAPVARWRPASR